jgi:hypothetical protein
MLIGMRMVMLSIPIHIRTGMRMANTNIKGCRGPYE